MITPSRLRASVVDPQTEWTRRRLQALLVGGLALVLALLVGGIWSIVMLLQEPDSGPADGGEPGGAAAADTADARDELAERTLSASTLDEAKPGALSTGTTGTIRLPVPTGMGPAGVLTGYPATPEGALAQLAAIDQAALSSLRVAGAQAVIKEWAASGGPTTESWSGVKAVAGFLSSAGVGADGADRLVLNVTPSMGLIKGTVGDDFVVPCLNMVVEVTDTTANRAPVQVAVADCQRMVWSEDRWIIGPGQEPAEAPSLWPGTQASYDAGYQWLETTP
ncbi:hypothetical protein ACIO3S_24410 [Nocardioides sp. NPDC087217]|uniref:hypothetical protein n=1 Tax=Nocardioides sp. NPDC087217 TaxID=3364335 RepID=UPI00381833CE